MGAGREPGTVNDVLCLDAAVHITFDDHFLHILADLRNMEPGGLPLRLYESQRGEGRYPYPFDFLLSGEIGPEDGMRIQGRRRKKQRHKPAIRRMQPDIRPTPGILPSRLPAVCSFSLIFLPCWFYLSLWKSPCTVNSVFPTKYACS